MRRNTFPPRPRSDDSRLRAPELPKRKVFNCIVDDTALIAGAKKSTRDGIRKWIQQDAIRLFVPLHTLTQLNHLKNGEERYHADARDALTWLDDVTSESDLASRIQLEGAEEAYNTWAEVEQYMLPETLLSMEPSDSEEDDDEDEDEYQDDLESSLNALDVSDGTSMSSIDQSPKSARTTPVTATQVAGEKNQGTKSAACPSGSPARTARNSADVSRVTKSSKNNCPLSLRPLFNHILWRIHQESNPDAALDNFILLTNDPVKQAIAQKFGIRAKRLEQLRDAVMREDREFKNHMTVYKKESEEHALKKESELEPKPQPRPKSSHSALSKQAAESDEEEYVLVKNVPRGPANGVSQQRVFDPNEFGRSSNAQKSPRGGRGNLGPRGRGSPLRGNRGASAGRGRGGAYVPPQPVFQPQPAPRHDPNRPIDPDSFTRPATRGNPVRGGRRTLWEPN